MQTQALPTQNTEEWLRWRREGLGASDANVIMGQSKMTLLELYEDKLDLNPEKRKERQEKMAFIASKGHKIEEKARARFELENLCEIPPVAAVHQLFPYMRASLDGYENKENFVWECKYVGEEDFQRVQRGEILEQYRPQLMHQLYVTGAVKVVLYVMTEEKDERGKQIKGVYKSAQVDVFPDIDYIADLKEKEFAFWECVLTQRPPSLGEGDSMELKDKELGKKIDLYVKKSNQYNEKKKKLDTMKAAVAVKELKDEAEALKKEIFKSLPHNRVTWKGHSLLVSTSKRIDYKAAFEQLENLVATHNALGGDQVPTVDLSKFTKEVLSQKFTKAGK